MLAVLAVVAAVGAVASPASAQFQSEGYKFLKAVEDREGDVVTAALNEPGSTVVNHRDISSGESALHIVTKRRDTVWVKFLTQRGANPNVADKKGITPLEIASNLGFIEGVEALLKAGARIDVANVAGETPLIAAVHRSDIAMVQLLLANGASPERNDNSGRSARDYVALIGNTRLSDEFAKADAARKGTPVRDYGPSF